MNKYWNKIIGYISLIGIVLACFMVFVSPVQGKTILTKTQTAKYLDKISEYEMNEVSNPAYGSVGGEWLIMGLARYGTLTEDYLNRYLNNLKIEVEKCGGVLSERKYTEYARVVLALTAIDVAPDQFAGYDLLCPLAELDHVVSMGMNGVAFSLLAFDCGDYTIPNARKEYKGTVATREKLISMLLKNQLEDGGWAVTGKTSEVDVTAMVLQALAKYSKQDKVKKSINRAISLLSSKQNDSGAFSSAGNENCESTAQVLAAMATLKIKVSDQRFIKNEKTILDGLLQFYKEGGFKHTTDSFVSQMSTEQAMYALTAYYRSLSDENSLYDMKDNETYKNNKNSTQIKTRNSTKKRVKQKSNKNKEQNVTQKNINKEETTTQNIQTQKKKNKGKKVIEKESREEQKKDKAESAADNIKQTKQIKEQRKNDKKNKNYYWLGIMMIVIVLAGIGVLLKRKNKLFVMLLVVCITLSGCGKDIDSESHIGKHAGTCTILVECSTINDNLKDLEKGLKGYIPKDGIILKEQQVSFQENDSVYDILYRELKNNNKLMEASFTGKSAYVEGIDNIYEFSCGKQSGWLYCVNGKYQKISCSEYKVKDGDKIQWHYTCNLGEDVK